jgi:ABC-type sulfate/molybdate transport systems ATPase subunit
MAAVAGIVSGALSASGGATGGLAASGLTVDRGGRRVIDGVDLDLRPGEVTALLGPNGAGKSTLLGALSGTLPAARGEVAVAGRLAAGGQSAAFARRSVRANVELALAWWGVPRGARRARATETLRRLGVEALAERHAHTLSGGEARRVHLARVLAVRPDVLLLDEPFAGLDPTARAELLYDVAGVLRDPGRATCIVVHDRAEAWALADRVAVLLDGRIAATGPPDRVLDAPPNREVARFLGFSGEVADGASVLMARVGQTTLDPAGPFAGRVARRIPIEDGVRLEVALDDGTLVCNAGRDAPAVGTPVRLRVDGGVRFPR